MDSVDYVIAIAQIDSINATNLSGVLIQKKNHTRLKEYTKKIGLRKFRKSVIVQVLKRNLHRKDRVIVEILLFTHESRTHYYFEFIWGKNVVNRWDSLFVMF